MLTEVGVEGKCLVVIVCALSIVSVRIPPSPFNAARTNRDHGERIRCQSRRNDIREEVSTSSGRPQTALSVGACR